jgi:hypothetical protein
VYVLDERLEPVPVGGVGELYVGGTGVARGYMGDPARTADRFVPDQHGAPAARMYATGDRARWRDDGVLELLGRRDGQVKVRGVRVELAEIEAVLVRHPDVAAAVVAAGESAHGEKRLAAYVVPGNVPAPDAPELRRWLRERLPEPMVPSCFVLLESLPLSSNGKLDRSALPVPAPESDNPGATGYVAPGTATEEVLAGIVADLVGLTRLGVHDNFFEIGVDSIVGMRIVSRARQAGLVLDPVNLFRFPNVAELAATARSSQDREGLPGSSTSAVAPFELIPPGIDLNALERALANQGGIEDLYPLTPVQEGMLFHTLTDPEAGHYVEQFVCRLRGDLDLAIFKESWRRLVARHPALRSTIQGTDSGRPYQVVHRHADYSVDYHDWRGLTASEQNERLRLYLDSDCRRGFVPSRPPLSRLALFRLEQDIHELIWSIHHVLIDGWCLAVLLHEILDIEQAVRQGQEPALKPSRPFRDYVAWLRDQKDDWAEGYWRNALKRFGAATPLGLDGPSSTRRGAPAGLVADRELLLPAAATAALGALARSHGLTLSTVLQGAWALLLSRYSGQEEVLFGVTVAGRPPELAGVESMVGMFINVLPLRIGVNEQSRLIPWLGKVQTTMVELRRFEATPPTQIRSWSEVPRGMPLFESIVIIQNLPFVASLQERASHLGIELARYLERTHYPLAVTFLPGTELGIKISFDSDRFDGPAIDRMLGHLRTVLEAMADRPDRRLVDVPSITEDERAQLTAHWNGSEGESHRDEVDVDRLTEDELDALIHRLR